MAGYRREWCRLILSAFLAAFTFISFGQMVGVSPLHANPPGFDDDSGIPQPDCDDDDNDPFTSDDDGGGKWDDVGQPDDNDDDDNHNDDCDGGGGGGGGSGGSGGIFCPPTQDDKGHVLVSSTVLENSGEGDSNLFMPMVINEGSHLDARQYYPAAVVHLGFDVIYMDQACCSRFLMPGNWMELSVRSNKATPGI